MPGAVRGHAEAAAGAPATAAHSLAHCMLHRPSQHSFLQGGVPWQRAALSFTWNRNLAAPLLGKQGSARVMPVIFCRRPVGCERQRRCCGAACGRAAGGGGASATHPAVAPPAPLGPSRTLWRGRPPPVLHAEAGMARFVPPVFQGFAGEIKELSLPGSGSRGHDVRVTLIARRSLRRAGCRQWRRGADLVAAVANFVESEQLTVIDGGAVQASFVQVSACSGCMGGSGEGTRAGGGQGRRAGCGAGLLRCACTGTGRSLVAVGLITSPTIAVPPVPPPSPSPAQIRGSIPLLWSQTPCLKYKIPIRLAPPARSDAVFAEHARHLIDGYRVGGWVGCRRCAGTAGWGRAGPALPVYPTPCRARPAPRPCAAPQRPCLTFAHCRRLWASTSPTRAAARAACPQPTPTPPAPLPPLAPAPPPSVWSHSTSTSSAAPPTTRAWRCCGRCGGGGGSGACPWAAAAQGRALLCCHLPVLS